MASKARILLVDDETAVRSICGRILSSRGYHVSPFANATEALQAVADGQAFELLLTDLRMPGTLDGLALAQELRRRLPGLRVILMTAFPSVDSAVDSMRLGTLDYLVKPFDADELLARVKAGVESSPASTDG